MELIGAGCKVVKNEVRFMLICRAVREAGYVADGAVGK